MSASFEDSTFGEVAKISNGEDLSERKRVGRRKAAGRKEPYSDIVGKDDKGTVTFFRIKRKHES